MNKNIICTVLIPCTLIVGIGSAYANGFREARPWQFRTPNERAVAATIAVIIERKDAGGLDTNITNNIGRQINCYISPSAIGNVGNATHSGSGINPTGVLNGSISADTTGNQGQVALNATSPGPINQNSGGAGSTLGQTNDGSTLGAEANNSSINGSVGDISANGADIDNVLNLEQSNSNTKIAAVVNGSTTCRFTGS